MSEDNIDTIKWKQIDPQSPFYLFTPFDKDLNKEYQKGFSLSNVLPINSVGIVTSRDHFTIDFKRTKLWERINKFVNLSTQEARSSFNLRKDVSDWKVNWAQDDIREDGPNKNHIVMINYRPFDIRFTYYTGKSRGFLCRPRSIVMDHMLIGDNVGLVSGRSNKSDTMNHFFISNLVTEAKLGESTTQSALFPIYLIPENSSKMLFDSTATSPWEPDIVHGSRVPNLDPGFVTEMENRLNLTFDPHLAGREHQLESTFGPEDVLAYIYAVFHSPIYRERYAEFLKIDFPRVPLTSDLGLFRRLVGLGRELIALHLLEAPVLKTPRTSYPVPGDNRVAPRGGYPRYTEPEGGRGGRVYINREQYFEGVPPEVWAFEIGGYQVLHKWLKDRRGRVLEYDDKIHYQQVVVALSETLRLMAAIDAAIPAWPMT